jgi:inhibitor of KinA sporulation pathway (predicted exonuclease)
MEIIVWDTEYTTWEGAHARNWNGKEEWRELVQLAARRLNIETGETVAEQMFFVKPVRNPELSDFFMELTKVTQEQVDQEGLSFAEALETFEGFVGDTPCFSYGPDVHIFQEGCVTHQIPFTMKNQFYDARVYLKEAGIDVTQYTSGTVSRAVGINLEGHVHDAMHDVNSLSTALITCYQDGKFKLLLP